MPPRRRAFATLLTSAGYLPGALALAKSLARAHADSVLYVLATPAVADAPLVADALAGEAPNARIRAVPQVPNPYEGAHPRYADVFAKLHCWRMSDVADVVVFLDADTAVVGNISDLFERPVHDGMLAAAPDIAAADLFNAGVMVIAPSEVVADRLFALLADRALPAYDTGDQGFLNSYFGGWYASDAAYRLPLLYNAPVELAIREPAYFATLWSERRIKLVHYWGSRKPWHFWRCFDHTNPVPREADADAHDDGGAGAGAGAKRANDAVFAVRQNKLRKMVGDVHFDLLVEWWNVYTGRDVRVSADALRAAAAEEEEEDDA